MFQLLLVHVTDQEGARASGAQHVWTVHLNQDVQSLLGYTHLMFVAVHAASRAVVEYDVLYLAAAVRLPRVRVPNAQTVIPMMIMILE